VKLPVQKDALGHSPEKKRKRKKKKANGLKCLHGGGEKNGSRATVERRWGSSASEPTGEGEDNLGLYGRGRGKEKRS